MDISKKMQQMAKEMELDGLTGAHMELFGDHKLMADGCYGIAEYDNDLVRLNLPRGQILVLGQQLELKSMEGETITVIGKIHSIEFIG